MKKIIPFSLIIFSLFSCSDEVKLQGTWDAVWETSPESFGKITGIESFTMNGKFIFQGDSITIVAHGYKGCVFGVDTIQHSQTWKMQNDTLYLSMKATCKEFLILSNPKMKTPLNYNSWKTFLFTLKNKYEKLSQPTLIIIELI